MTTLVIRLTVPQAVALARVADARQLSHEEIGRRALAAYLGVKRGRKPKRRP